MPYTIIVLTNMYFCLCMRKMKYDMLTSINHGLEGVALTYVLIHATDATL